jgi:hypothetical protein
MKRLGIWIFYCIGALAVGYLALYAWAVFTGHNLQPGDPIHIFRKPDAPSYSWMSVSRTPCSAELLRSGAPQRRDPWVSAFRVPALRSGMKNAAARPGHA